jgi:LacI family transcriptional regulator, repressor for deo operon, udp, cdd, tsx, nupC, and nupG
MTAAIEDVARRAGVSVATVSRALRGLPNVAPSTRERVIEAARALQYVADPYAARLAAGRSLTVGLVVPALAPWYYARLFSGAEARVTAADLDILPFTTSGHDGVQGFLDRLPFRKRVDGLIVADASLAHNDLDRIVGASLPVVTLGFRVDDVPSVTIDDVAAARLATLHLARLGHRRIAVVGGADEAPSPFAVPVARFRGYREGLEAADVPYDPDLCAPAPFSLEGGAEAMHRLLHLDAPPTAVFACSDELAIGALRVLRDASLDVPEDVSLVGFDDHDVAEYLGLTTVRQDVAAQGERVAAMLLALVEGEIDPDLHEVHPTRLVVRRTTAPPP